MDGAAWPAGAIYISCFKLPAWMWTVKLEALGRFSTPKATIFCNHCPAHVYPLVVYEFRPNITTVEGLLAAATMLSHSEQLELLDELKHMMNST